MALQDYQTGNTHLSLGVWLLQLSLPTPFTNLFCLSLPVKEWNVGWDYLLLFHN